MQKQGTKTNEGALAATGAEPEAEHFYETGAQVKHIKKISAQPTKIVASPKPSASGEGPRHGGGCIPVGD